eukprot:2094138-Karenia_brevis.AAC.1
MPMPRTVTFVEMMTPIRSDVATDMGPPRHCPRNVGIDVAKCRFMVLPIWKQNSAHKNVSNDVGENRFHGHTDIREGKYVGTDIVRRVVQDFS